MSEESRAEKLEEELKKQNERIEEFGSIVSHDLRNPLNLAKGYLDLAEETGEEEDFEQVREALERIEKIIEHMLFIAREPGNLDIEEVDLEQLFEEVWEEIETGEASYETEAVEVSADRSSLKNMLESLVSNSLNHNTDQVTIRIGELENGFYFEDDGSGIDESIKQKIFDYGFSTSEKAAGFGMSVIERISNAHGWDCSVKKSGEGGARLEFRTE